MAVSLKKLNEQIMVITGASSGIGLVTARMAVSAARAWFCRHVSAPNSWKRPTFSISKIEQGRGTITRSHAPPVETRNFRPMRNR